MGKQYNEEQKTEALKLLSEGKSLRAVSKELNIPFQTIFSWGKGVSETPSEPSGKTHMSEPSETVEKTGTPSGGHGKSMVPQTPVLPETETVSDRDLIDEALKEERDMERDIDARLETLRTAPVEAAPFAPSGLQYIDLNDFLEFMAHVRPLIKDKAHPVFETAAKNTLQSAALRSRNDEVEVERLRQGSSLPSNSSDLETEKERLELELAKTELAMEKEFLKNMRLERYRHLMERYDGNPRKSMSIDELIKLKLAFGEDKGGVQNKVWQLYLDAQGRVYDLMLKGMQGGDVASKIQEIKTTMETLRELTKDMAPKEKGFWESLFTELLKRVTPSDLSKSAETLAKGAAKAINQLQASAGRPPPPQSMTPKEMERTPEQVERGLPPQVVLSKLDQSSTFAEIPEDIEAVHLPPEETEEAPTEPEATPASGEGGSLREIEKRRKGKKKK